MNHPIVVKLVDANTGRQWLMTGEVSDLVMPIDGSGNEGEPVWIGKLQGADPRIAGFKVIVGKTKTQIEFPLAAEQ